MQMHLQAARRFVVFDGRFLLAGKTYNDGPGRPPSVISGSGLERTESPKRILVVEDNLDSVHSLAILLADIGHTVEYAINGYVAVDLVQLFRPDVVLLDLGLPGIDGFEVCRRIKRDASLRLTRVVALTAFSQEEYRARAKLVGIEKYLVKPVELKDLEDALS